MDPKTVSLLKEYQHGSVRALSRLISFVENRAPSWMEVMKTVSPLTGRAKTIGVTGVPGAGKSTLTNGLARMFAEQGKSVGIIAVDPSSPFSGGSIMGDRIRMKDVWDLENVYIRSMATRGVLGGLSQSTRDVIKLLDGFGKEIIIVETVGVGQDEVDVIRAADLVMVVLVPGQGDGIQAIKAGIMEIADIYVINKADREGADRLIIDIESMLELASFDSRTRPPILKTIAIKGEGISKLSETALTLITNVHRREEWIRRRISEELVELVEKELIGRLLGAWNADGSLEQAVCDIREGKKDLYTAAQILINKVRLGKGG